MNEEDTLPELFVFILVHRVDVVGLSANRIDINIGTHDNLETISKGILCRYQLPEA
jgi:hypothetical protein